MFQYISHQNTAIGIKITNAETEWEFYIWNICIKYDNIMEIC